MDMELPHVEISQEETERAVMNESILGITCGDVGGIGLECLLKAWTMASHPWRARLYAQPEHLLGVAETLNVVWIAVIVKAFPHTCTLLLSHLLRKVPRYTGRFTSTDFHAESFSVQGDSYNLAAAEVSCESSLK